MTERSRVRAPVLVRVGLLGLIGSGGCVGAGVEEPAADDPGTPVHGLVSTHYRGRWAGSAGDHDLNSVIALDVGDPERDALTFHALGRVSADLDGRTDRDGQFVFPSLADTFGSDVSGLLYSAYVDVERLEDIELLRLGRQRTLDTPEILAFDGARIESAARGEQDLRFGVYGGLPVHHYESSSSGDAVLGVFGELRPWKGGRLRLDWLHLEDETRLGTRDNDIAALGLWQALGPSLAVEADWSRLESRDRDVRLHANWFDSDADLSVQVTYYELLEAQKDFALEVDPFSSSLLEYRPFREVGLLASKGIADRVNLEAGVWVRRLAESVDEGEFNHDFEHYTLRATVLDAFTEGLTVSGSGDVWVDDQQDVQTFGLDLGKDLGGGLEASVGTYYSLYKYDLFLNSERDDVRTWFMRLELERSKAMTYDLSYEYEDDDLDTYHILRAGLTWRF